MMSFYQEVAVEVIGQPLWGSHCHVKCNVILSANIYPQVELNRSIFPYSQGLAGRQYQFSTGVSA